jgi:nucleoside-diphosphate-sugar epimerase
MKKVVVTGVAGFIGSKTTEQLLQQSVEVVGIDKLNDYYDVSLKTTASV